MTKLWWDELALINNTGTSYAAVSSGAYTPVIDGKLVGLKLVMAGDAVTSEIYHLSVKLTEPSWGRDVIVAGAGAGILTAPAAPIENSMYDCDMPVKASQKITIQAIWSITAVTPHVTLMGLFEAKE